MSDLVLYVGNKNYSSWSFRPWIALEAAGVPFTDRVIPFDFAAGNPEFRKISPTGRVPVLHHGEMRVWESLAIIEYAADLFPDAGIWPKDRALRAEARIETLWKAALARSGGPFLFGAFSAADAMYAPVVNRLEVYCLTQDEAVLDYMARMKAHPAWQKWQAAAVAEPWTVPEDEV
jgi:glutathione S-transferase